VAGASRAEEGLTELLQSFWFDFGRWVGTGELAARARSEAFFAEKRTTRFLESAAERGGVLSADDAAVLHQIGALAGQGVTRDEFDTIRQHFLTLIRRHGG
jgi:fructosamine-3-kinase